MTKIDPHNKTILTADGILQYACGCTEEVNEESAADKSTWPIFATAHSDECHVFKNMMAQYCSQFDDRDDITRWTEDEEKGIN